MKGVDHAIPTNKVLRGAFGTALAGGTVLSFFGSYYDSLAIFIVAGPLSAMALYFLWYYDKTKMRHQVEQFADSLYYLGFLFTLLALVSSLAPWVFQDSFDIDAILPKFGMALTSTVAGLFGRVLLTQFEITDEEAISDTSQLLAENSQVLAAELALTVARIKEFREEAFKDIDAERVAAKEYFQKQREEMSQQLADGMSAAGGLFAETIGDIGTSLKASTKEFTDSLVALTEGSSALVVELEQCRVGLSAEVVSLSDLLKDGSKNFAQSSSAIQKFIKAQEKVIAKSDEHAESIKALSNVFRESSKDVEKGLGSLVELEGQVADLRKAIELAVVAAGKLEKLSPAVEQSMKALDTAESSIISSSERINQLHRELEESFKKSGQDVHSVRDGLLGILNDAKRRVDSLPASI